MYTTIHLFMVKSIVRLIFKSHSFYVLLLHPKYPKYDCRCHLLCSLHASSLGLHVAYFIVFWPWVRTMDSAMDHATYSVPPLGWHGVPGPLGPMPMHDCGWGHPRGRLLWNLISFLNIILIYGGINKVCVLGCGWHHFWPWKVRIKVSWWPHLSWQLDLSTQNWL